MGEMQKTMSKSLKTISLIFFFVFYMVTSTLASIVPYMSGGGDGGLGFFIWLFAVWIFAFLMLLVYFSAVVLAKKIKPYLFGVVIFIGSAIVFLLNYLILGGMEWPHFKNLYNASTWMLWAYAFLPFIYGGLSYILSKNFK